MDKINIKLHRYEGKIYGSYGSEFEARLSELGWQRNRPTFKIPDSKIKVTTHEDGADIVGLLPDVMQYVGYIVDLAALWVLVKPLARREKRTLQINVGGHRYEGVPKDKKEARKIMKLFEDLHS